MLVSLDDVKTHVQVDHDEDDIKLQGIAEQASEIVIDYLKKPLGTWQDIDGNPVAVPKVVIAATLLVAGALYADREGGDPISSAVQSLLMRQRDPAVA